MQKSITKKLNQTNHKQLKTALLWAVLLLALDRCLKITALTIWSNQPQRLVGDWTLTYNLNQRLAFSLPWTGPSLTIFLTILILILTIYATSTIKKQPNKILGWTLLLFGAYSNLYDRFVYNGIIDYITSWWTIFNLADLLVGLGLIILLWPKPQKQL